MHGITPQNLLFNGEERLEKAKRWELQQEVNWTKLGTECGLTTPNHSQIVKELLADNGILAALQKSV